MKVDGSGSSLGRLVAGRAVVIGLLWAAGCHRESSQAAILRRTQTELLDHRFTIGRLVGQRWSACVPVDSTVAMPAVRCEYSTAQRERELADYAQTIRDVNAAASSDSTPALLRARALVDLWSADQSTSGLERAIASLESARRHTPANAEILNDLAVAYLELGARDQELMPLVRALDAVDAAVRHDSTLAEARYNRALILDRLYLLSRADHVRDDVISGEPDARWKTEAIAARERSLRLVDTLTTEDYPQTTRDAFFRGLGPLGAAIARGDDRDADGLLASMQTAGDSVARLGADSIVAVTCRWIAGTHEWHIGKRRRMALALVDFATGLSLNDSARYEDAVEVLARAEPVLDVLGFPAAGWVSHTRAAAEANQGHHAIADRRLRALIDRGSLDPALEGKALWLRGVVALRDGEYELAGEFYTAAAPFFIKAKDRKNLAGVSYLLTETLALAGQTERSASAALAGLRGLARYRQSIYLNNHLLVVAAFAREQGFRFAALEMVDEAVAVDSTVGRADATASALCTRGRDLAAIGDSALARSDLAAAEREASRLVGFSRRFALTTVDLERGRLMQLDSPDSAAILLARAADGYVALARTLYVPGALLDLALVAERKGDTSKANERLTQAIELIERERTSFTSAESRAAFYETVERVFDAMIDLKLNAGNTDDAFRYLERSRVAVAPGSDAVRTGRMAPSISPETIGRALPDGAVFVAYAVLPRRTIIWTAAHAGTHLYTVAVRRDSIATLVARTLPGTSGSDGNSARIALYALVMQPLEHELATATQLIVAPDRELSELSFAALRSHAGRYVIEERSVRTLPGGDFLMATRGLPPRIQRGASALVVGDPLGGMGATAGSLGTLRGAQKEAARVAEEYRHPRILLNAKARRASVMSLLPNYSVFHFAGHAVFNPHHPELSSLILADSTGHAAELQAREIAHMDLSNVELVILSACSTLAAGPTRSGAVAGLAYSFLRAGVPRIVSTLWDVADDAVVDVVVELHKNIVSGMDIQDALRQAQLTALHSPHEELHSPSVWGALIYTGP